MKKLICAVHVFLSQRLYEVVRNAQFSRDIERDRSLQSAWQVACGALHWPVPEPQSGIGYLGGLPRFPGLRKDSHQVGLLIVLHETWKNGTKFTFQGELAPFRTVE